MEQGNHYLKQAILEIVDNQLNDDDPPQTRQTFERLVREGQTEEDARIYIGQAVCVEIWDIMKNKKPFDQKRYLKNLDRLPEEPTV
jgi:hypothetical protein